MSGMCLAKRPDVFKVAVAGAMVSSWDGYDTCCAYPHCRAYCSCCLILHCMLAHTAARACCAVLCCALLLISGRRCGCTLPVAVLCCDVGVQTQSDTWGRLRATRTATNAQP